MTEIREKVFGGERPLFGVHNVELVNVRIDPGESAIKECSDVKARHCEFIGKYPFWHVDRFEIIDCVFRESARAALWYCRNLKMRDTLVEAPKMFREMERLDIANVHLPNALETFWHCSDVKLRDVEVEKGDYLFMHSCNIDIDGYRQDGNYSFQYCRDVMIRNAVINSRDAFWESENVTVYDSVINGEFLGWHSKNLRLVNCRIGGTQPLCYADNLVMENCTMDADCDLAFEYSTLRADIAGHVTSIKNPTSGHIKVGSVHEVIIDHNPKLPANCIINIE